MGQDVVRCRITIPVFALMAALSTLPESVIAPAAAQGRLPATDDRPLVASIQELLAALGYDVGKADGLTGQRTKRAIGAFQRTAGLPVDGRPSEDLYRQLTRALNQGGGSRTAAVASPRGAAAHQPVLVNAAALAAAVSPAAGNSAAAQSKIAGADPRSPELVRDVIPPIDHAMVHGTRWRITDSDGASFELVLEAGGHVAGTAMARFWQWERSGGTVRLIFDNEWGGRVVRTGQVIGDRISGTAQGGGRTWTWHAKIVPAGPDRAAWSSTPSPP